MPHSLTATNAVSRVWIRVWGDFNNLAPRMLSRRRWMPLVTHPLKMQRGDLVLVYDGDGNEMRGEMERTTDWGGWAVMDESTWLVGEHSDAR